MSLFLAVFFLLYGGMHYFAFRKIRMAISLSPAAVFWLIAFMVVMVFAPIIVRLLEREGFGFAAVPVAYTGYLWMGFLFLFCTIMLAGDLGHLLLRCGSLLLNRDFATGLTDRQAFFIVCAISLGITVYGYGEALSIRVERVVVPTTKLPSTVASLRIVQVSDVHLGLIVREQRLGRILNLVEKAKPDLLVSTGDLVDGQIDGMSELSAALGKVRPPLGKFAVTGNHEYYAGIEKSLDFMRHAGFTVLHGETHTIGGMLTVAGVDDPAAARIGIGKIREDDVLRHAPRDRFVIFLKHRPVVARDTVGLFDLQLSGHIHKGQIFPFGQVTRLFYPAKTGLSRLADSCWLYVSRGTGTWGPPIRFLAPPEVTVIDLVNRSARG
ncbi:MAG TPA: metallophosphoesterase [Geobacteraceae bacterium]|nr:metallophosphoesterase [Geobacteraceae bacterium]